MESLANSIIKEKQPFERLEMTKDELLEMFNYSKYKEYFINQRVPDGTLSTVYRCGPLIDLCRGPHVPTTGNIKAFTVLKVCLCRNAACYADFYTQIHSYLSYRTLPHTGSATAPTNLFSEFLVFHSLIRSSLRSTRHSLKRLRSATTERLAWSKSCSSSTRLLLVPPSSCHTAPESTMLCWS